MEIGSLKFFHINWVAVLFNGKCKIKIGIVKWSIKWNKILVLGVIIKDMRAYRLNDNEIQK